MSFPVTVRCGKEGDNCFSFPFLTVKALPITIHTCHATQCPSDTGIDDKRKTKCLPVMNAHQPGAVWQVFALLVVAVTGAPRDRHTGSQADVRLEW